MRMNSLWSSSDVSRWSEVRSQKDFALKRNDKLKGAQGKVEALRKTLQEGSRKDKPYLTKADLVDIVTWKLHRGTFRPTLLGFAKEHTDETVKAASEPALQLVKGNKFSRSTVESAVKKLSELKGVGPATSAAILYWFDPRIPFMGDEALVATQGKKEYKPKAYMQLFDDLTRKAGALGEGWSAGDVEECLWIESVLKKAGVKLGEGASAGKKRKAEDEEEEEEEEGPAPAKKAK